jgi:hypothetical protein
MAKNKLSDELEKDKGLLKDIIQESGHLYDALTSIGENIATAINNAVEGADNLNDTGKAIANTYKRDIVNSIKASARSLEKHIGLQHKITKGINVERQIKDEILKIDTKKDYLIMHINSLKEKGLVDLAKEEQGYLKTLDLTLEQLDALEKLNKKKQKSVSIYSIIADSLGGILRKIDKTGTLTKLLSKDYKEVFTFARMGQLASVGFMTSFVKGVMDVNKQTVGIQKNMGLSGGEAAKFRAEMAQAAIETGTTKVNTIDTLKTVATLNEQFGTAATTIRKDIVGEMALLGKYSGLSAESQGSFAAFTMKSGMGAKEVTLQARRAVIAAENEFGVRLDINKTLDEAGKITGLIRANLGFNIVAISGAIAKAKQFGMTLQDLAGISANLLNFQSSIEAELTAELFTGKQLNLEKARLYALTGDYKGLTDEIKANAGGELEFAQMNVLAKEKLAAALGMSADQMSNMVYNQANLAELAEKARNMGNDELADSLTKRDIQQQFNDLILKAQTILVDMAAGPLGDLAAGFGNLLENSWVLYGLLGMMAAVKFAGLISGIVSLGAALGVAGIGGLTLMSALTLGIGVAAIAAGIAIGANAMKKEQREVAVASFQDLPAGKMVTVQQGEARIHQGEFVGHQSDFNAGFDRIVNAILSKENNITVQSHHGTRYV